MKIVVTQGETKGIGPEVLLKALPLLDAGPEVEITVLGDPAVLEPLAARIGAPMPRLGVVTGESRAFAALEEAARRAAAGEVDAIVTAPVSKLRLRGAGFEFPGQTEFFAKRLGARDPAMMLCAGSLRVVTLSTHIRLAQAPAAVTRESVLARARTLHSALVSDFGIDAPRIAVLGLNPHAGEGGLLGREELEIIQPAVDDLKAEGLDVVGPVPADAAFTRRRRLEFDGILGMYHDQALGPFKALADGEGVNVTLGLPVVRTSPDHGTAEDIVGRDEADPTSMLRALQFALSIASRRKIA